MTSIPDLERAVIEELRKRMINAGDISVRYAMEKLLSAEAAAEEAAAKPAGCWPPEGAEPGSTWFINHCDGDQEVALWRGDVWQLWDDCRYKPAELKHWTVLARAIPEPKPPERAVWVNWFGPAFKPEIYETRGYADAGAEHSAWLSPRIACTAIPVPAPGEGL